MTTTPPKPDRKPVDHESVGIPRLLDETVSATWDDVKSIVDAKIELLKIDVTEKMAILGMLAVLALMATVAAAFSITTLAFFLGEIAGHTWIGFLLVSLLFAALVLFFTKVRPDLLKTLIQKLLLTLYDTKK